MIESTHMIELLALTSSFRKKRKKKNPYFLFLFYINKKMLMRFNIFKAT
jgi:hypothetical protein